MGSPLVDPDVFDDTLDTIEPDDVIELGTTDRPMRRSGCGCSGKGKRGGMVSPSTKKLALTAGLGIALGLGLAALRR